MRVYSVMYQLIPWRNPNAIAVELQKSPGGWFHHFDYAWLVATTETANQIYNRLAPMFNDKDRLLILEIKPHAMAQGWLPEEGWKWIQDRVPLLILP